MFELLMTAGTSFVVAFFAVPVIILVADKKKLYDIPDERKLHTHSIASLGGIGVFVAMTFSSLLGVRFRQAPEFQYFFAALFVMFFIGLKDDIIALSAFKKFIIQIVAAAVIIHLGGVQIQSLYGILGVEEITPMYGIPLTYITIILVVNAYNLIDGVDGLAGSLGLMATLLFGTYFYLAGMSAYATFSSSLSAALLAFLIFNFQPAKIFLGDCGSLLVGTSISILLLKFITVASIATSPLPIPSAVAIGFSVILVPLIDTVRVFSIRIIKGRSPFSPDRNHVHHILLAKGFAHASVTLTCVFSNILVIIGVYSAKSVGNTVLLSIVLVFSFSLVGVLYFTSPRRTLVHQRQIIASLQAKKAISRVISLSAKKPISAEKL